MEGRLIFKDVTVWQPQGGHRHGQAVVIEGETISAVGDDATYPVLPGDWEVRANGRILVPGQVDGAAGLVSNQVASEGVARLTPALVEAFTAHSIAEGLSAGVTCFFESLDAPTCVEAALTAQASVASRLGARLVNAHMTSTASEGFEAVDANARYAQQWHEHTSVRGAIGIRANGASGPQLRATGKIRESVGVPLFVDSGRGHASARTQSGTVRLETAGLLGDFSHFVNHGHLSSADAGRLGGTSTNVALAPEALLDVQARWLMASKSRVMLGTSGWSSMWQTAGHFFGSDSAAKRNALMQRTLITDPAAIVAATFKQSAGAIAPGHMADVVLYDAIPPTDAPSDAWYPLLARAKASWVVVKGAVVVREGRLLGADVVELARDAARAGASLRWTN